MGVSPTARSVWKISGGSQKYRKGVDHRKGVSARKGELQSGAELCIKKKKLKKIKLRTADVLYVIKHRLPCLTFISVKWKMLKNE